MHANLIECESKMSSVFLRKNAHTRTHTHSRKTCYEELNKFFTEQKTKYLNFISFIHNKIFNIYMYTKINKEYRPGVKFHIQNFM